jgi:hypothetical protein
MGIGIAQGLLSTYEEKRNIYINDPTGIKTRDPNV